MKDKLMTNHKTRWLAVFLALFLLLTGLMLTLAAPGYKTLPNIMTTFEPPPQTTDGAPHLLVSLTEYNPWRMVIGSDMPTFALYSDWTVIYLAKGDDGQYEYRSLKLEKEDMRGLWASLNVDSRFYRLEAHYDTVHKTDQPNILIRVNTGKDKFIRVSVYGDLRDDAEARAHAPKTLLRTFDRMIAFKHPKATQWLPKEFEVVVWPYDNSEAAAWPTGWPDLNSPTTIKRDTVYSLYVDMGEYDRFRELVKDHSAVRINGKTWAFSVRFPFPHERPAAH
jgi:hypothetical protein